MVATVVEVSPVEVLTAVGTRRSAVVVSPTSDSSFCPQQYAALVVVSAQLWYCPTVMLATLLVVNPVTVETAVGLDFNVTVLSPSCPSPLRPQQYARPPVVSAQAW